ncbi:MAG TPA: HD domain-containing phosphohydrolase [Dehalococcoidia bacterium]|nr:HD domain-containing phosphohydrolase [Dehalococcoidia bacterium]
MRLWTAREGQAGPQAASRLEVGEEPRKRTFFLEFTAIFAAVALALSLAAGFALTGFLARDIRSKTLNDLKTEVSAVTARRVLNHLPAGQIDGPLAGGDLAAFDTYVRDNVLSSRTVRLNVVNAGGTVIYSNNPEVVGDVSSERDVRAALGGDTVARVERTRSGQPELAGLEAFKQVVVVTVPLTAGEPPQLVGVLKEYRDYSPIAAHISDVKKSVFISIAAALGALYLALLLLVRRGSNTIRRQQGDIQRRSDELRSSYESIVAVLCAALDLRDNVTHGHAQRVSQLASVIAWQMGLRKEQVRQVEKAAILHDIGKIGVADAVLSKPGPLDDGEWAEMRRHPELGFQILNGIDFLRDVADIVYSHHERWDGAGYPRGLKAEQIPQGARIFAVVDAFDAMTSHRPYRKAQPASKAVPEIVRNSGTQFDPTVVEAFLTAERRGLLNGDGHDAVHAELAAQEVS